MNIILAHGLNHGYKEQFWPELIAYCKSKGYNILATEFPNNVMRKNVLYENWKELFNKTMAEHQPNLAEIIFISHSLGSLFTSKWIIEQGKDVAGFISVSGAIQARTTRHPDMPRVNYIIMNLPFVSKKLQTFILPNKQSYSPLSTLVKNRTALFSQSDDDKYFPLSELNEYANLLQAEKVEIKDGGHLTKPEKVMPFLVPAIAEMALNIKREK